MSDTISGSQSLSESPHTLRPQQVSGNSPGAGPLLLAHRVVPGVLALSLTRQVGGGSSVLLHDYASVLLQPPDLLLKAAASISLLGNHTHRMWVASVRVFFLPVAASDVVSVHFLPVPHFFFLWYTGAICSLGTGGKSSSTPDCLLFWQREGIFKLFSQWNVGEWRKLLSRLHAGKHQGIARLTRLGYCGFMDLKYSKDFCYKLTWNIFSFN